MANLGEMVCTSSLCHLDIKLVLKIKFYRSLAIAKPRSRTPLTIYKQLLKYSLS
jgi:hypothetical protein